MNKDASDFMIIEYERISSAYFSLRDQTNDWFKAYLTVLGLPLTILTAILKITGDDLNVSITEVPDIISYLFIFVSILGLFVSFSIISMRMEMILYARTINGVRRYFAKKDKKTINFLILPTSDNKPPFYETWRAMYWQVIIIGIMDAIFFFLGFINISKAGIICSIMISLLFIFSHWAFYRILAWHREKNWNPHFLKDLNNPCH